MLRPLVHDYDGDLVTIEIGGRSIGATGNHPFWVVGGQGLRDRPQANDVPAEDLAAALSGRRGRWIEARELQAGDLLVAHDGSAMPVELVQVTRTRQKVFNLQVADLHTYAVSDLGIAVHNKPCFPPGTLIFMGDGSTKPIEQVKLGDRVLAADPEELGSVQPHEVVGLIRDFAGSLIHISMVTRDGESCELTPTRYHPCWTSTRGWVEAQDLIPGDVLRDAQYRPLTVTAIWIENRFIRSYNLSVDEVHTFFALASDRTTVLVHNADVPGQNYFPWYTPSSHGNAINSGETTYLYRLQTKPGGQLMKWGVTIEQPIEDRYSSDFLKGREMIPIDQGTREDMLRAERFLTETRPGPLNNEKWAGLRENEPVELTLNGKAMPKS